MSKTIVICWGDHDSWCKHTNFHIDTRVPIPTH